MKKNLLFIPTENAPKASKVSLNAKQFYLTFSLMLVFLLSLVLFLMWSYQTQEHQKQQLKISEQLGQVELNQATKTSLPTDTLKNINTLFSIQQPLSLSKESLVNFGNFDYWKHLKNLNARYFSAHYLRLPQAIATAPKNIQFPYEYIITGSADTSYAQLAQIFYGATEDAEYLASENNDNIGTVLQKGDKVTIYPPNIYPSLTIYDDYKNIPHFLHTQDQILDENGVIYGTPEEIEFFVRVVVAESDPNWTYEGFRMIAESIANRIRISGHSIWEVLTAEKQYDVVSSYNYLRVKVSSIQRKAALAALVEKTNKYLPEDVIYFATEEAVHRTPWFRQQKLFKTYGGVMFFSAGNGESLEEVMKILEKFQTPSTSSKTESSKPNESASSESSSETASSIKIEPAPQASFIPSSSEESTPKLPFPRIVFP